MNRWCDGFGRYGGTKAFMLNGSSSQAWAQVDANFALSNANPRTGNWHLRLPAVTGNVAGQTVRRVFGAPLTEVFIGFAVYADSLPVNEAPALASAGGALNGLCLCSLRDQANVEQIRLMLGTDGALELQHRANSAVLGRSIPIIGAGAYQHIEIHAVASNTVGAFEVRVDEITRLNVTGVDTVATANIEFSQFAIYNQVSSTHGRMDFADFFVNDTTVDGSGCDTFVGDCKSGIILPNADTAQADFAKSTGAVGYQLIDETPPDDADYLSTAVATAESDFGLQNGPSNLAEILTMRPFVRAWKEDAGTCKIAPSLISSGVKATVADQPITTAAAYYDSNVPLDPNTGVPWVAAGLNAAVEAIERTA